MAAHQVVVPDTIPGMIMSFLRSVRGLTRWRWRVYTFRYPYSYSCGLLERRYSYCCSSF